MRLQLAEVWHGFKQWCLNFGCVVRNKPTLLVAPVAVTALLILGSVLGVEYSSRASVEWQRKVTMVRIMHRREADLEYSHPQPQVVHQPQLIFV